MKNLLIGLLLGWVLNSAALEYAYFEHYDLTIDALDKGYKWKGQTKGLSIEDYVEARDTDVFDILLWRPELWKCRWIGREKTCLIKALIRHPIPIDQRPKTKDRNGEINMSYHKKGDRVGYRGPDAKWRDKEFVIRYISGDASGTPRLYSLYSKSGDFCLWVPEHELGTPPVSLVQTKASVKPPAPSKIKFKKGDLVTYIGHAQAFRGKNFKIEVIEENWNRELSYQLCDLNGQYACWTTEENLRHVTTKHYSTLADPVLEYNPLINASDNCSHSWADYHGLSETFEYCTKCDHKKGAE